MISRRRFTRLPKGMNFKDREEGWSKKMLFRLQKDVFSFTLIFKTFSHKVGSVM